MIYDRSMSFEGNERDAHGVRAFAHDSAKSRKCHVFLADEMIQKAKHLIGSIKGAEVVGFRDKRKVYEFPATAHGYRLAEGNPGLGGSCASLSHLHCHVLSFCRVFGCGNGDYIKYAA